VDAEFLKQLCAEQLVTRRDRRGYLKREWQKTRERNEALDCYVYARAAAAVVGLDRMSEARWAELEEMLGRRPPPAPAQMPAPSASEAPAPETPARRRRYNPFTRRMEGHRNWLGSERELRNWLR
jgi:phage terminase large subunit GpA-like protein